MEEALWACDITNWYKHPVLSKCTFPTRFVELPDAFVARILASEGLFARVDEDDEWSDNDWGSEEDQDAELEEAQRKEKAQQVWPELEAQIKAALTRWVVSGAEGGIFPRLNWSSPIDAHWMGIGGSLRCTTVGEVIRFLEASDQIRGDLELLQKLANNQDPDVAQPKTWKATLALRRWHDFHTPNEFRCFVRENQLIAVCQKDVTNFWPFLVEARQENTMKLSAFFDQKIKGSLPIASYVYDAYVHSNGSVWLVDISPFHEDYIEPILWSWEELRTVEAPTGQPPMRIIEEATNIMPNLRRMATAVPFDLVQPDEGNNDLADVDPNNMEALVEKLQRITEAAEKLNAMTDS